MKNLPKISFLIFLSMPFCFNKNSTISILSFWIAIFNGVLWNQNIKPFHLKKSFEIVYGMILKYLIENRIKYWKINWISKKNLNLIKIIDSELNLKH